MNNKLYPLLMKTALIITLAITLASGSMAFACDGAKTKATKKANTSVEKSKKTQTASAPVDKGGVLLTGSYIKQNVRPSGRFNDGTSQVIVLDRDIIERSGASDVKQLLIHQGIR